MTNNTRIVSQRAEPRSCPFCGGTPSIVENDSYGGCGISCGTCDIMPEHACGRVGEIDRCIAAWNTRPEETLALSRDGEREAMKAALRSIAYMRPAGDISRCAQPKQLVERMERIAIDALAGEK